MKTGKTEQAGKSRLPDEWVYGLNPVLETIRSGRRVRSVFVSSSRKEKVTDVEIAAASRGIKIQRADAFFFDDRFPKGHQGIAALVAPRVYFDIEDLINIPAGGQAVPLFLVLDCLEDPRNFGAILRVADAGGVHGVVMQSHRSVALGPEAAKASAGASEYMPVAVVPNIKHAIHAMRERGVLVVGTEAEAGKTPWDLDLRVPLAIVVGSEGRGLRRTVRENCDVLVSLPMMGRINSLNVSVATGAIIFEVLRQRMSF